MSHLYLVASSTISSVSSWHCSYRPSLIVDTAWCVIVFLCVGVSPFHLVFFLAELVIRRRISPLKRRRRRRGCCSLEASSPNMSAARRERAGLTKEKRNWYEKPTDKREKARNKSHSLYLSAHARSLSVLHAEYLCKRKITQCALLPGSVCVWLYIVHTLHLLMFSVVFAAH